MLDFAYVPGRTATTTPEIIAAALRDAILRGTLKSGQALPQDEIAARFGVSKIPAREALVQLKAEGLVSFAHHRGATVTGLSADEVEEIYDMRVALETLALRRAIPNLGKPDFVRAEGLIEIMDDAHDALNWSALNWEFHAALYQASHMPRLLEHIRTLHANVARYLVAYLTGVDYYGEAQRQHRVILAACRGGDAVRATEQLATHLSRAARQIADFLRSDHPPETPSHGRNQ